MNDRESLLKYINNKKLLMPLNLHSMLFNWFSKFLVLYPLNDKELKTFNNLIGTNKKLGFLSRKLMKVAKQNGIPNEIIKYYYEIKNSYKFYKTYKRKFKNISSNGDIDRIIRYSFIRGREFERSSIHIHKIHKVTIMLIKAVIEKTDKSLLKF
jgi:hypothetical protein